MCIYRGGTKMEERLVKGFEKLINSDVIKNIYPMVDHINISNMSLSSKNGNPYYVMTLDIVVNDSLMTKDNMFDSDFDPHWMVDKYIADLSKYLSISIRNIFFTVHNLEGDLIYEWLPF